MKLLSVCLLGRWNMSQSQVLITRFWSETWVNKKINKQKKLWFIHGMGARVSFTIFEFSTIWEIKFSQFTRHQHNILTWVTMRTIKNYFTPREEVEFFNVPEAIYYHKI